MEKRKYTVKEIGELAHDFQNGDKKAIAEVYIAIRPNMVKKAYKHLDSHHKSAADAEDVFEESFLKAMEKISTLHNPDLFVAWFSYIVENEANTLNRKYKRYTYFTDLERDQSSEHKEDKLEKLFSSLSSEDDDSKSKTVLKEAMAKIPAEQQELLNLFYIQDYSYEEICAMNRSLACADKRRVPKEHRITLRTKSL